MNGYNARVPLCACWVVKRRFEGNYGEPVEINRQFGTFVMWLVDVDSDGKRIIRGAVVRLKNGDFIECAPECIELVGEDATWHPCEYVHCKLEHDGSWVDGKWYVWRDVDGNEEIARMKLDGYDHFYPSTRIIEEEKVVAYREVRWGVDNIDAV